MMAAKSERTAQLELMTRKRRSERDIAIPSPADPERRLQCEQDHFLWLSTYQGERFFYEWTADQKRIVNEIIYRLKFGGDKAIAAPRSIGKTTITESCVGVFAILMGLVRFPVIAAATGPDAGRILNNIKEEFELNQLLLADYPEVCAPIAALDRSSQRAKQQTTSGDFTLMEWSDEQVKFPTVTISHFCPGCYKSTIRDIGSGNFQCMECHLRFNPWPSKSSGSLFSTRGMDAAVRGLKRGRRRPDFIIIDDPETPESARSEVQTDKREAIVEKDLGGLGDSRNPVSRLMLTTLMNCRCLGYRYTDRTIKPSWDGERLRLVNHWPTNKGLWEKYVEMRQLGMEADEPDRMGRHAFQFYIENREAMDEGTIVADPHRYSSKILEDGLPKELSTIQSVHNEAADKGWDYVLTELQNAPPEDGIDESDNVTLGMVVGTHQKYAGRLNGLEERVVPDGAELITAGVDVQHDKLYFEIVAWMPDGSGSVVHYGEDSFGIKASEIGLHEATIQRLLLLKESWLSKPLVRGEERHIPDMVLVDSADSSMAVYQACELNKWTPIAGATRYKAPLHKTEQKRPGRTKSPWFTAKHAFGRGSIDVIKFYVDWFRHASRDSWRIIPGEANSIQLFGDVQTNHLDFGRHISGVQFKREFIEGKGWHEEWKEQRRHDYWDTHMYNLVARSICMKGLSQSGPRRKLSDMQGKR